MLILQNYLSLLKSAGVVFKEKFEKESIEFAYPTQTVILEKTGRIGQS